MSNNSPAELITALQTPAPYDHPTTRIQLRETHVSWVFLTGDYVYKIKKPVDFGFLDFSTLEQRKFYCEEEVRLNRRLAPDLYLDVVPLCGSPSVPQVSGAGTPFEYAVKMRQFDTGQEFDALLARGELTKAHLEQTAQVLADFHGSIAVAKGEQFGTPQEVHQPVLENFDQIAMLGEAWLKEHRLLESLQQLHDWSSKQFKRLEAIFTTRKLQGYIRECHGDLHLRNIVIDAGRVTPFDGIEFNPNLRWIDVMSELAFLLMDLDDHQRLDLSRCLRDRYLSLTGDYAGLSVLRYYLVYRAMVRAKVAGLQLLQVGKNNQALTAEVENYLQLALDTIGTSTPCLLISHGLSGSGKTFISERLLEQVDLIRLRSDVERKRMFRMAARSRDRSGFEQGIYSKEAGTQTYQRLLELAAIVLEAGYSVLVDAAFLKREQRQLFADYAAQNDIPFLICHSEADIEVQRQRLRERAAADTDASDANVVVLERQLSNHEPLTEEERKATVTVDTTRAVDLQAVLRRLDGTA